MYFIYFFKIAKKFNLIYNNQAKYYYLFYKGEILSRSFNVLIVDDVEINREFIKTVVTNVDESLEINVYEAVNGDDAFNKIKEIPNISLVILDMMMPEYDGFYFLEKYTSEFSKYYIPIIVMSAAGDNDIIKKAYNYGIYDYFIKPLSSDKFLSFELKLKNALKMREALFELDNKTKIMENDIRLASKLQYQFLPKKIKTKEVEFSYYYKPYSGLSGDYIDFFEIDNDKFLFVLADVVGHGTASAIIGAILKTHTSDYIITQKDFDLKTYIDSVNNELLKLDIEGNLVTAFVGVYSKITKNLQYIIAGHPYPLRFNSGSKEIEFIKKGAFLPLGLFEDIKVEVGSIDMNSSDTLIAYTDGIMEARDKENNIYGLQNIIDFTRGFIENNDNFVYHSFIDELLMNFSSVEDDISIIFLTVKE